MSPGNVSIVKVGQTREEKRMLLQADGLPSSTIELILDRGEMDCYKPEGSVIVAAQPNAVVVSK